MATQGAIALTGYSITEPIYIGSRTLVYRAVRESDQTPVVLKYLRNEMPTFGEFVQFRNQYAIAKHLNLPGIIQYYGLEPCGNADVLVMEDFGGISLPKFAQGQPLDVPTFLAIALQLADILHYLYQHRIIHKDIKTANILIHPGRQQVKLIDFSIASLLPRETQAIQNPNGLEGTLAYLSPEQTGRMNRGIDYRSDFYSLGVTFYELLTGQFPFQSSDPMELVHAHLAQTAIPIHQINPNLPIVLSQVVAKLMAKNAEDRYQSALGLKHDLQLCYGHWQKSGTITDFVVGQHDISDRFTIPEKLYGREAEVQRLLSAFDRVAEGSTELMLMAGFSGVGKTAVVNEVHKPIVRQHGYFVKGKYDQFQRNIPFSAFVKAFRDLMDQLLNETDAELAHWTTKILEALGENGQVIIDLIPELEGIVGKQPSVPELSGTAAQNRFNVLFQKFIQVFTTSVHPLVIFLDDLQWADSASLKLLQVLMNDMGHLLILGAYRDNEVSLAHPLMLAVNEIAKSGKTVETITLKPLFVEDANRLVADTLSCSLDVAQPLTELVYQKTQGNPFFTTQVLKALYQDKWITFEHSLGHWQCDIAGIRSLVLTDDVVEFMARQLQKLPITTQKQLKLAACIGAQFDLHTLAIVSDQSPSAVAADLWKPLQEGLILPIRETYKFFQFSPSDDIAHSHDNPDNQDNYDITVSYKFLHDRIQQAAYSLILDDQKQQTHLQIGRRLLGNVSRSNLEEKVFEIVNQFNLGKALIEDLSERLQLAEFNLRAGLKAKSATAYVAAVDYLKIGIEFLPADGWQSHHDLSLVLYSAITEAYYLSGNFQASETYATIVQEQAKTFLEQVPIHNVKIQACMAKSQHQEALQVAMAVLKSLGVDLPEPINQTDIDHELNQINSLLATRKISSLLELPQMTDSVILAVMQIFSSIVSTAYQANPILFRLIVFRQVQLSIIYGNAPESTYAYATYGLMLCGVLGDIEQGYELGQLALQLVDRLHALKQKSKTLFAVNCFVRHWKEPVKSTLNPLLEAYQAGLDTGDIEYAAMSAYVFGRYAYLSGQELNELEQAMATYGTAMHQLKQSTYVNFNSIYHQSVLNLLGRADNPNLLIGESYNETIMLPIHQAASQISIICQLHFCKLILNFLFQDYRSALVNAAIVEQYLASVTGLVVIPTFYFYESLTRLNLYADAPGSEKPAILQRIQDNQDKLRRWAQSAPMNYSHKTDLIEAEYCRVTGQKPLAIDLYDRAISHARENGYTQEEALANELAAQFYLEWDKEKIAQVYLTEAYYGYARWGAKAKVDDLEQRYPQLLRFVREQSLNSLNLGEIKDEINFASARSSTTHLYQTLTSSSGRISDTLDLATVLRASQALSSEIKLEKLLAVLLQIVMENSGSDKGALIMPQTDGLFVETVATIDQSAQVQSIPLDQSQSVPISLINRVKRRLAPVVIADTTMQSDLVADSYIQHHQPQSLLCAPILQQGKLIAILYLENHRTKGVFTGDRVKLLNLLCAQAAISLENARLYQQAQRSLEDLKQAQLQIVQSEKMSALGNLVAGVAHEINNPVGFLKGNIQPALDYIQDLFGLLDLYQEQYPNPETEIQAQIEEIDLEFLRQDLPKLVGSMQEGIDRIRSISTSLRTFSRADSLIPVAFNLHEGLDSTMLILKHRLKANEFRPEIAVIKQYGAIPQVECFAGQINQVFMNILSNAIDAIDESCQGIDFTAIEANPKQISVLTEISADLQSVIIRIQDNGLGIPEAVKSKVFDHLFTTKPVGKGTGLGLAITHQIVTEKHKGCLAVHSTCGQGAEFVITLPIKVEIDH